MTRAHSALALMVMFGLLAAAQDSRVSPPVTMRENTQVVTAQAGAESVTKKNSSYEPPFCPPKTCLYYAGDFNSDDSNGDGLFNADYDAGSLVGQVWVGVKPDRDATVTGATFVQSPDGGSGYGIDNPTPFAVQVGIKPGQAGKTICSTSGNATQTVYGGSDFGDFYAYTIKKLSKSCKLKKGEVYYVNLLPTSNTGYGFLMNVEDAKPKNHHGWKNDLNDCYFNGAAFDANYVTCDSQGIGDQFSELSIALTGKQTK